MTFKSMQCWHPKSWEKKKKKCFKGKWNHYFAIYSHRSRLNKTYSDGLIIPWRKYLMLPISWKKKNADSFKPFKIPLLLELLISQLSAGGPIDWQRIFFHIIFFSTSPFFTTFLCILPFSALQTVTDLYKW